MKLVTITVFFISSLSIFSQEYTLQDCINLAIKNNLEIEIERLNVNYANQQYLQTKLNRLPSLSYFNSLNQSTGYSINPLDYSYTTQSSISGSTGFSAQITLFNGFQQIKNSQKGKIQIDEGKIQIDIIKNQVRLETIKLFLEASLEKEALEVSTQQYKQSQNLLSKSYESLRNGLITSISYKDLQLQVKVNEMNYVKQENRLKHSLKRLKLLLRLPENRKISIANYIIDTPFNTENAYSSSDNKYFNSFPQVNLEKNKLSSLVKQIEINKGTLYPTITFTYAVGSNFINTKRDPLYKTIPNPVIGYVADSQKTPVLSTGSQRISVSENIVPIFSQLNQNIQHQFQLNFQWQIFNKGIKRTNIKLSSIIAKQQEYRVKLAEIKIRENYSQAISNIETSYNNYIANLSLLIIQKERYSIVENMFLKNLVNFIELNTYLNELNKAELELSKSKIEWYFNKEILKLYE